MSKHKRGTNNINRMRRNRGLAQKQLAPLLGFRFVRQIIRYERAESLPTLKLGLLLEIVLGARLSELYPELYRELQELVLERAESLPIEVRRALHGRILGKEYVEYP